MSNLGNAEELGGIAVVLGYDDSKVVSGLAGTREKIAAAEQQIQRQPLRPAFDLQEGQIRSRMASIISDMRKQAEQAKIVIQTKVADDAARQRLFGPGGGQSIAAAAAGVGSNIGIGTGTHGGFGDSSHASARSSRAIGLPDVAVVRQHLTAVGSAVREEVGRIRDATAARPVEIRTRIADEHGRTRSAGGGGGHGNLANKNLLSLRGLETSGLVGSATAAYAIMETLRVGGEFAEAGAIAHDTGRIARRYDAAGSAYDAVGDRGMAGNYAAQAAIEGSQKRIGAVEGIPIIGSLAKIGDAMTGLSESLEADAERLKKGAAIHADAVEFNRGSAGRIEGMTGNRTGEAAIQASRNEDAVIADVKRSVASRYAEGKRGQDLLDPEVMTRLANTRIEGHIAVQRTALAEQGEQIGIHYGTLADRKEREAAEAQAAGRGDDAFRLQQEAAELRARGTRASTVHAAQGTNNQSLTNRAAEAAYNRDEARRGLENTRRNQEAGYAVSAANASRDANRQRIGRDDFGAEMTQFRGQRDVALQRMTDQGAQPRVVQAERERLQSEEALKVVQHHRDVAERIAQIDAGAESARLRRQGKAFEGELQQFDKAAAVRIAKIQDSNEKRQATLEYGESRAAMLADERNQQRMRGGVLEGRFASAGLVLDRSLPLSVQDERGAIIGQGVGGVNEILGARQRDRENVRKVNVAEMRATIERLTGVEGGAVAGDVEYGTQIVGDPLGISGIAQRNRALQREGQDQINAMQKANPDIGGGATLKDLQDMLKNIFEKITPPGTF